MRYSVITSFLLISGYGEEGVLEQPFPFCSGSRELESKCGGEAFVDTRTGKGLDAGIQDYYSELDDMILMKLAST